MVRAKFKVDEIKRHHQAMPSKDKDPKSGYPIYRNTEVRTVVMSPVYGNGDPEHENTKFWHATPSGKLELGWANLTAAEMFELGKEYYVDFTLAE
jgi:hypothetical protein